ncbi:MAG: EVE domain-containing protein [Alphaproteobacteria bacterium]|nr:MAG: EVE domain-containing protein [Alphaproteobacteria bacterium]
MAYWLLKSEPGTWSWDDQTTAGTTHWNGVRNAQALGNMRRMKKGDKALFYHSGKDREIVGLVEIVRAFYPDPEDEKSGLVDVRALKTLPKPVHLAAIKADKRLAHLALVRQSRLSVMPIDAPSWQVIAQMGGL